MLTVHGVQRGNMNPNWHQLIVWERLHVWRQSHTDTLDTLSWKQLVPWRCWSGVQIFPQLKTRAFSLHNSHRRVLICKDGACAWTSVCWDYSLSRLGFAALSHLDMNFWLDLQGGVKLSIVFYLSGWVVDRDSPHSQLSGARGMLLESQLCKNKHLCELRGFDSAWWGGLMTEPCSISCAWQVSLTADSTLHMNCPYWVPMTFWDSETHSPRMILILDRHVFLLVGWLYFLDRRNLRYYVTSTSCLLAF